MATSGDIQDTSGPPSTPVDMEDVKDAPTPDIHNISQKLERARRVYKDFERVEEQPTNVEITLWYLYGMCSYFVHTVLIPILFPLIVSQVVSLPKEPKNGWYESDTGNPCREKEMRVFQALIQKSISVGEVNLSPLGLTGISWAAGILVSAPILGYLAPHLDHGESQHLIFGIATAVGGLVCLPVGFFGVKWIFPPYIAAVVIASVVTTASHTRHLGLMVRGFTTSTTRNRQFPERRSVSSWLSLHATAAGCLGAGIISAFIYRMLHHNEKFMSLWIVSIFSGLKWIVGTVHAFSAMRPGVLPSSRGNSPSVWSHIFSIFKYPHAAGSLVAVFLSSFTSTSIFTGGILYIVGELCLKPVYFLSLWLIYFIFPLFSLPLLHPLQLLAKTDAVRMKLLGLLVSATTSGLGYYFRKGNWNGPHIFIIVAIQSTAAGILHAFGRGLVLDCTPPRKEGVFSAWYSLVRTLGACGGFAVASAFPKNITKSFSVAFYTSMAGVLVLIFGNISNYGGAVAAGHVKEEDKGENELDWNGEDSGLVHMKAIEERHGEA
ncbi:hypothetical protein GIB67_038729 [Kingdonia uniflora]|uniref:Uncharacterized protein n=1 Tax=Kingdonia uniflora TaxID=39325 RepID=A0A7J7NSN9_9MAGN|nr:hypothetical protein GIB67_038729 [Kingdonia uniflora]